MVTPSEASASGNSIRVLYSFPNRIGAGRICTTAWHQVAGIDAAGCQTVAYVNSAARPLPASVMTRTTFTAGRFRFPMRILGRRRSYWLHDFMVAHWLDANHTQVDVVHVWPLGNLRTGAVARRHGIPVLLERPNAHTAYAFEAAGRESDVVGIGLPKDHDHFPNPDTLMQEEKEYAEADYLLCPSPFVASTFIDRGYPASKLLHHRYGYDEKRFFPPTALEPSSPLSAIYVGVCEPRKGLHYALQAWLASEASKKGTLSICGEFVPGYREALSDLLRHPSIIVMGHVKDIAPHMRQAAIFLLPSVEEGSALVTYEARASGCCLLVSDASGAPGVNGVDILVHPRRSVEVLTSQLNDVSTNPDYLLRLRSASLKGINALTWPQAGVALKACYAHALRHSSHKQNVGLAG